MMTVRVRAVPRAKKEKVESFEDGLKVYFSEPAIGGRGNRKLIEILARYYNTKKGNIAIIKGAKQRDKIVRISEIG